MGRKLSKLELKEALLKHPAVASSEITFLTKADHDAVIRVKADAFSNDPMWLWVAGLDDDDPQKEEKMYKLSKYFISFISHRFLNGEAGLALGIKDDDGALVGSAFICPSACKSATLLGDIMGVIRLGLPPVYKSKEKRMYCPVAAKRFDLLFDVVKKRHKLMKDTPRYMYLEAIGVSSSQHGKGHGSKLLRTLTSTADSLGIPIYLETEAEHLESMYHHFGFRTAEKMVLKVQGDTRKDASHTMYLMIRDAKQ
mmetsp:Transcript_1662/g.3631  ORF Transcript_1662/g.3631 Transcript_1662/m.3631 type:complete len:254 (-) Transcript_1662:5417-6178(-)